MTIVADGKTDNTVALQQAINAAIAAKSQIVLPAGRILIGGTITANASNQPWSMVGAGQAVTQIIHNGSFGDALVFKDCGSGYFANFGVTATAKMAKGANLNVSAAFRAHFDNIYLQEGFVNLRLGNVVGATFRRMYTGGGTYGYMGSGSYNLWLASDAGGVSNGLDFDGCFWEGGGSGQSNYDESVRVDNVDGAWFRGGHIYGGANAQVVVNSGPAVTAVTFDAVYFEHGATYGLIVQNPSGTVDGLTINACQFNNQPHPFAINGFAPPGCVITSNRGMKAIPALPNSVVANNV